MQVQLNFIGVLCAHPILKSMQAIDFINLSIRLVDFCESAALISFVTPRFE